jgi:hypothetical protein
MFVKNTSGQCNFVEASEVFNTRAQYTKSVSFSDNEYINDFTTNDTLCKLSVECLRHHDIPYYAWKYSQSECRLLINKLFAGTHVTTQYKSFSDGLSKLALHAGYSADVYNERETHTTPALFHVTLHRTGDIPTTYDKNTTEVLYNDKVPVYCLQVPSEVFYVRRNGKSVWTGNSRARGPKTSLTRQAPEGRSRDGGLRLGEMERDALIAHGIAKFLKEKLLDNSDPYTAHVCDKCGLFAQRFNRREDKHQASDDDVYHCPSCNNFTDINKIKIPYAFKLFIHELMAMCIASRIRCKKEI